MHSHPEAADTLIVGAQLYDGTGAPPVERDVAIRDGRIAAIGNLSNWLAEEVIEAEGRALAPGLHRRAHARRHARDPLAADAAEDHPRRDDGDRRQLRHQRIAGVAEGRSARSDEPARRA
ncbi:cytosine/adenosine deaminase-related metal-dependent hydrolase [Paraburkholderia youngii]